MDFSTMLMMMQMYQQKHQQAVQQGMDAREAMKGMPISGNARSYVPASLRQPSLIDPQSAQAMQMGLNPNAGLPAGTSGLMNAQGQPMGPTPGTGSQITPQGIQAAQAIGGLGQSLSNMFSHPPQVQIPQLPQGNPFQQPYAQAPYV